MVDTATTIADLNSRIQTGVPLNVTADTMRAHVNTLEAALGRRLNTIFTGTSSPVPLFVDTPPNENGEQTVDLGTASDTYIDVVNGEAEILKAVRGTTTIITLNLAKSGGGTIVLSLWLEVSTDAKATWTPIVDSGRKFEVTSDGEGSHHIVFSNDGLQAVGTFFRLKITKLSGSGTLTIEPPTDAEGFRGTITSFAAKADFIYAPELVIS